MHYLCALEQAHIACLGAALGIVSGLSRPKVMTLTTIELCPLHEECCRHILPQFLMTVHKCACQSRTVQTAGRSVDVRILWLGTGKV